MESRGALSCIIDGEAEPGHLVTPLEAAAILLADVEPVEVQLGSRRATHAITAWLHAELGIRTAAPRSDDELRAIEQHGTRITRGARAWLRFVQQCSGMPCQITDGSLVWSGALVAAPLPRPGDYAIACVAKGAYLVMTHEYPDVGACLYESEALPG